jgi:hypothetical protein
MERDAEPPTSLTRLGLFEEEKNVPPPGEGRTEPVLTLDVFRSPYESTRVLVEPTLLLKSGDLYGVFNRRYRVMTDSTMENRQMLLGSSQCLSKYDIVKQTWQIMTLSVTQDPANESRLLLYQHLRRPSPWIHMRTQTHSPHTHGITSILVKSSSEFEIDRLSHWGSELTTSNIIVLGETQTIIISFVSYARDVWEMNYIKVFPLKKFLSRSLMSVYRFQKTGIGALVEPTPMLEFQNYGASQTGGKRSRRWPGGAQMCATDLSEPTFPHYSLILHRTFEQIVPVDSARGVSYKDVSFITIHAVDHEIWKSEVNTRNSISQYLSDSFRSVLSYINQYQLMTMRIILAIFSIEWNMKHMKLSVLETQYFEYFSLIVYWSREQKMAGESTQVGQHNADLFSGSRDMEK